MATWQQTTEKAFKAQAYVVGGAPASDSSIDDELRQKIDDIEAKWTLGSPYAHLPRLVEPLLGDIAALLDRCLAYQAQASEFEILAVVQILEEQLAKDIAAKDLELCATSATITNGADSRQGGNSRRSCIHEKRE